MLSFKLKSEKLIGIAAALLPGQGRFTAPLQSSAAVRPLPVLRNDSYLPVVDGFRAAAVLIVLVAHFGLGKYIPGGFGVMLFFFISGFLITRLLMAEYEKTNGLNLKRFYIRRLVRLYPPLLFMLLVFPAALLVLQHTLAWKEILSVLFYFENYYLVYFPDVHSHAGYFNIFWSLAVEEHFYLAYPVLFLLFYKKRSFTALIALFVVLALVVRLYYVATLESPLLSGYDDPSYEPTYMLSHCRFDSILFGCLSALLVQSGNVMYKKLCDNKWIFSLAMALLLFCFVSRSDFFRNSFRYSLQGLALMFIVPPIVLSPNFSWLNKALSANWIVMIGKLSYSLYVTHWVAIMLAGELYPQQPMMYLDAVKPWPWYLVAFPLTIGLTAISYYVVEKRFIRLRKRFGSSAG